MLFLLGTALSWSVQPVLTLLGLNPGVLAQMLPGYCSVQTLPMGAGETRHWEDARGLLCWCVHPASPGCQGWDRNEHDGDTMGTPWVEGYTEGAKG